MHNTARALWSLDDTLPAAPLCVQKKDYGILTDDDNGVEGSRSERAMHAGQSMQVSHGDARAIVEAGLLVPIMCLPSLLFPDVAGPLRCRNSICAIGPVVLQ